MDERDLEEEGKNRKRNVLGIERKIIFLGIVIRNQQSEARRA
jgi:hypothetical protein